MENIRRNFEQEKRITTQILGLIEESRKSKDAEEKKLIDSQISALKEKLRKTGQNVLREIERVMMNKPLTQTPDVEQVKQEQVRTIRKASSPIHNVRGFAVPETEITPPQQVTVKEKEEKPTALEKLTLKRMKKKEVKVVKKKEKKPSTYVKFASKMFFNTSLRLLKKGKLETLRRDLIKANLEFIPANYFSVVFFTTLLSVGVAIFVMLFFLFFNFIATPPFVIPVEESLGARFLKVFWIVLVIPAIVFLFGYFYPSLEKKSTESKINRELPFAAIHMSSISSSMIEPSKMFGIIITTNEYPNISKEFTKLLNEVNIYGYDLVTALRNLSFNSPSRKLAELYNGLATTITSGGKLPEFFEKRSQTLLFEHRLEREKQAKAAETFMDIYISVVIAAPMVLMLLLMMMRVSGLGISLSTAMITLVMILGVTMINIFFLTFLHLKQPTGG